eukprot:8086586-Heterocapsa_arctica.AAC.1
MGSQFIPSQKGSVSCKYYLIGHCQRGSSCNFRHDDGQFPDEVGEYEDTRVRYTSNRWSDTEDGTQDPGTNPWDLYMAERIRAGSGGYATGPVHPTKGNLKGSPKQLTQ